MSIIESILAFCNQYGWAGISILVLIVLLIFGMQYINKKQEERSEKLSQNILNSLNEFHKMYIEHINLREERDLAWETKREERELEREVKREEKEMKRLQLQLETMKNLEEEKRKTEEAKEIAREHREDAREQRMMRGVEQIITGFYANMNKTHKESENHRMEIQTEVSKKLVDLKKSLHAERVVIVEFHNGGNNLSGLSFIRYDVTHEKQQKHADVIIHKSQNLPASNIQAVINDINKTSTDVVIYKEEAIEGLYDRGATVLYHDLKKMGIKTIGYCGMYDDNNVLYALLIVDWSDKYPFNEQLVNEIELSKYASEIGQLYKYVKKF